MLNSMGSVPQHNNAALNKKCLKICASPPTILAVQETLDFLDSSLSSPSFTLGHFCPLPPFLESTGPPVCPPADAPCILPEAHVSPVQLNPRSVSGRGETVYVPQALGCSNLVGVSGRWTDRHKESFCFSFQVGVGDNTSRLPEAYCPDWGRCFSCLL